MRKYSMEIDGWLTIARDIIQLMWTKDEYANRARSLVWLTPISPPVKAVIREKSRRGAAPENIKHSRTSGPSFCQVDNIKQVSQWDDDITWGNQKWKGAAPSLIRRLIISIRNIIVEVADIYQIDVEYISSMLEPRAWIRKYLIVASVSWFVSDDEIIGIKDNILISSANHINNQFELLITIKVLITKVDVISSLNGKVVNISVWWSWTT